MKLGIILLISLAVCSEYNLSDGIKGKQIYRYRKKSVCSIDKDGTVMSFIKQRGIDKYNKKHKRKFKLIPYPKYFPMCRKRYQELKRFNKEHHHSYFPFSDEKKANKDNEKNKDDKDKEVDKDR